MQVAAIPIPPCGKEALLLQRLPPETHRGRMRYRNRFAMFRAVDLHESHS